MKLSIQQQAVVEWVAKGRGSAFVEAVAGSGKTTGTLIPSLSSTQGTVAFTAFNKKIVEEIKIKIAPLNLGNRVSVGTFHSFGFNAWRKQAPKVRLDERAKDDDTIGHLRSLTRNTLPKPLEAPVLRLGRSGRRRDFR